MKSKNGRFINGDSLFCAFLVAWFAGLYREVNSGILIETETGGVDDATSLELFLLKYVDIFDWVAWMREYLWLSYAIGGVYLFIVFCGPYLMKSFERPKWASRVIISWNIFLVIFSTIPSWRILSAWFHTFRDKMDYESFSTEIHRVVCDAGKERCDKTAFLCLWLLLFCLSKVPEMLDTVFLVITKKNIIFLHWYHHLTVMLFCWVSMAYMTPVGIVYCTMNYFVHSIMYAWYGFAAAGYKPARYFSQLVTILQILQMLIGAAVAIYTQFSPSCENNHMYATRTAIAIYGTYLCLFVKFFFDAYCKKRAKSAVKGKGSKGAKKKKGRRYGKAKSSKIS